MKKQPATTQRIDRAHKIAYWTDVQRIRYTYTLTAFLHGWALFLIGCLIPSALTVLQFLAALHRSSRLGYIGTAVAYELLAPQIARATGRPCSVRTLQRGLGALKGLGLVSLRYWTIPDQRIELGDGRHVTVRGTAKNQIGAGEWRSLQIRIVVLSDLALALWDKATKSQDKRFVPQLPTPAKLADRSQYDQVEDSTMVVETTSDVVTSTGQCQLVLNSDPGIVEDSLDCAARELQGRSTRPDASKTSRPTLEHQASTVPQSPASSGTPEPTSTEASKGAKPPANPVPTPKPVGCSEPMPRIPKGSKNKRSWSVGRIFVLHELHKALYRFSRREADSLWAKARLEMDRDFPAAWRPTSVDWDYWVPRFGEMLPQQRRNAMMSQILPILKTRTKITPSEPRRFLQGKMEAPQQGNGSLDPFLASLSFPMTHKKERKQPEPTKMSESLAPFLDRVLKKFGDD